MIKLLKYLLCGVVALLLLIFFFFTTTNAGLVTLIRFAEQLSHNTLQIELTSGSLTTPIVIQSLTFQDKEFRVAVKNITLEINPAPLLTRHLHFKNLMIQELTFTEFKKATVITPTTPHISLPLQIGFDHLLVQCFIYKKQNQPKDFTLKMFQGVGSIKKNTLIFSDLTFDYQQLHYAAKGDVHLLPIDFNLALIIEKNTRVLLDTTLKGSGNWQNLHSRIHLNVPIVADIDLTASQLLESLAWKLTANLQEINLATFNPILTYKPLSGNLSAQGTLHQLSLSSSLGTADNVTRFNFKVKSNNIQKKHFNFYTDWQNVNFSPRDKRDYVSDRGNFTLDGSPEKYRFSTHTFIGGHKLPDGEWTVLGNGNQQGVTFSQINAQLLNGDLNATGALNWTKNLNYHFDIHALHLDPSQQWFAWNGDISFDQTIDGTQTMVSTSVKNLSGKLRKQKISGNMSVQLNNNTLQHADVTLHLDDAYIKLSLLINHIYNVTWDINLPHLAKISPYMSGSLETAGRFNGTINKPTVQGTLTANDLFWTNNHIAELKGNLNLDWLQKKSSYFNISSKDMRLFGYSLEKLDLNVLGTPAQHTIQLEATTTQQTLVLLATGFYQKTGGYRLEGKTFDLNTEESAPWSLKQPFELIYNKDLLQLSNFSLMSGEEKLNLDIGLLRTGQLQHANVQIKNFSLAMVNLFLPERLRLIGVLNADANINQKNAHASGKINALLTQVSVTLTHQQTPKTWSIQKILLTAELKSELLTSTLDIQLRDKEQLTTHIKVPHFNWKTFFTKETISQGDLNAQFSDIDFLTIFFPQFMQLDGNLQAHLSWNGSLHSPNINGTCQLNGQAELPTLGLSLQAINILFEANNNIINYVAKAKSGDGNIKIKGTTELSKDDYKTKVSIVGDNFVLDNMPNYKIVASPDINVLITKKRIDLKGDLVIPLADINLNNYTSAVTLPSNTIVVQNELANNAEQFANLYANLNITLGKDVHLSGDNLDTKLSGKINVIDTPSQATSAKGQFVMTKGTYTAFGQKLDINNGKLIFAGGNIDNPGLDIRATRSIQTFVSSTQNSMAQNNLSQVSAGYTAPLQAKTIIVGVNISNTLQRPFIILFSDQAGLTQADMLSYLLLGYPLSNANSGEAAALMRVASSLNSNNGELGTAMQELENRFGITSVGVEDSSYVDPSTNTIEANTSLVLAKMLSPRLMVRYSIGLLQPINTISTSYALTEHWSAQTKSSSLGNGFDMIYSWSQK